MKNKFNLKSSDILNKKFPVDLSGYSAQEVDKYLDKVLEDYRVYEELMEIQQDTITDRGNVIQDKEDEVARLKLELLNLREQLTKTASVTNMELAKEIKEIKAKMK